MARSFLSAASGFLLLAGTWSCPVFAQQPQIPPDAPEQYYQGPRPAPMVLNIDTGEDKGWQAVPVQVAQEAPANVNQTAQVELPPVLPAPPENNPLPIPDISQNGPAPGVTTGRPPRSIRTIAPGYPYLNAPMYPVPVPDIPHQMGGTYITNQAFFPQEMLYKHRYRAMYPPFYYRVRGGWTVTSEGIETKERWELQGTEVIVKYSPRIRFWSLFKEPFHP